METQNAVSGKQKAWKIISYIINIFSIVVMIFSVFIVITSLTSKDRGYTSYFGKAFVVVQSNSMLPPDGQEAKWDNFAKDDVIAFNVLSDNAKAELKVGDVITFWDYNIGTQRELNTHRIVAIEDHDGDGVIDFQTKGDHNVAPDTTWRKLADVQGSYAGKSAVIGHVLTYLQSKTGFAVFIVVPCVLVMIYCIVLVIMNLLRYSKSKAIIQHEDNVDALKAELKAQLLKELEEEKAGKEDKKGKEEKPKSKETAKEDSEEKKEEKTEQDKDDEEK